jgi:hypothetical protein
VDPDLDPGGPKTRGSGGSGSGFGFGSGSATLLILNRLDIILHRLDIILHRLDNILHRLDIILHRLDLILNRLDLILNRLDLILLGWILSSTARYHSQWITNYADYTDKKENKIILIPVYRENQMGSGAKSYMKKGFLHMRKCANIYSYMRRPFLVVIYKAGQS